MIFRLISTVSIILVMSTNWTVSAKEEFSVDRELSYCRLQVKRALKELRPYNFNMQPRNILQGDKQKGWNLREAKAEDEAQQAAIAAETTDKTTKTTKTNRQAQATRKRVANDVEVITRDCGKLYSECDQVEKENRIVRYLDKFTENNPIIQGNRDNAFNKLWFQLEANGMGDEFARQVLIGYIKQSGLSDRDAKRLTRDRVVS